MLPRILRDLGDYRTSSFLVEGIDSTTGIIEDNGRTYIVNRKLKESVNGVIGIFTCDSAILYGLRAEHINRNGLSWIPFYTAVFHPNSTEIEEEGVGALDYWLSYSNIPLLDHFGYRWMPHRPAKEMFSKRAVIITQCLGAGENSTAKDIKDSLSWWGITFIKTCGFKLMSDIKWENIPEKKRNKITRKLTNLSTRMARIDYTKPARTGILAKAKFFIVRQMQTGLGKDNPECTDFKYWKANGWLGKERPWKR